MKKPVNKPLTLQLNKNERSSAATLLKQYLDKDLDIEISQLQSELFLDYINANIGSIFYNKGVADSMQYMNEKTEDMVLLMKD